MFVTVYSSLECPPRCCVRRLTEFNEQLSSEPLGHLIKPSMYLIDASIGLFLFCVSLIFTILIWIVALKE